MPLLPTPNYFWFHICYIAFMVLLGGIILWSQEQISYLDAIFISTSALSQTGLSSVDFSQFSRSSQVMVMLWVVFGGVIMTSTIPITVRLILLLWKRRKGTLHLFLHKEIRVLAILLITIWSYLIVIQGLGFIAIGSHLESNHHSGKLVNKSHINKWFWSLFHVLSSFQNAGFGLFGDNMISFAGDVLISLTLAMMTICGLNLWPVNLRFLLWIESKLLRGENKEAVRLLLREPRHFYYLLFSFRDTVRLLGAFLTITTIEYLIFFVEWNSEDVYANPGYSSGKKLMINFVQVIWVRNCGMNNVNIGNLEMGHLALLSVTMYVSSFPLIVTVRSTRRQNQPHHHSSMESIARRLLSRELVWLCSSAILISLIEIGRKSIDPTFISNPYLAVVFEIASAFGTVGLSVGVPGKNYSYSGILYAVSRFIILLIMFCGRHRGLPESIDPAVAIIRIPNKEIAAAGATSSSSCCSKETEDVQRETPSEEDLEMKQTEEKKSPNEEE